MLRWFPATGAAFSSSVPTIGAQRAHDRLLGRSRSPARIRTCRGDHLSGTRAASPPSSTWCAAADALPAQPLTWPQGPTRQPDRLAAVTVRIPIEIQICMFFSLPPADSFPLTRGPLPRQQIPPSQRRVSISLARPSVSVAGSPLGEKNPTFSLFFRKIAEYVQMLHKSYLLNRNSK
jgi:hypothetical protein